MNRIQIPNSYFVPCKGYSGYSVSTDRHFLEKRSLFHHITLLCFFGAWSSEKNLLTEIVDNDRDRYHAISYLRYRRYYGNFNKKQKFKEAW